MSKYTYNLSEITGFNNFIEPDYVYTPNTLNPSILKLNKTDSRTNNNTYSVIRYDKNLLCIDLIPSFGICRSIILNSANKIVSFAPPKSYHADYFIKKYDENDDDIIAEEFVEGTMINVFFDPTIGVTGSWEISTRNTVGATSSFFKSTNSKTFRQMFMEAAIECKLDINKLETELCYSFVVQHPENRIVVPFSKPQLYLVGVYKINNIPNNITVDSFDVHEYKHFFSELGTSVKFPQIYDSNQYSELIEKYGSMNTSYDIVGVVIHNKNTGERTKIRNPVYEQVRNLRGNQPKLQYQYLSLRKEGKVKDFLKFYPENKKDFSVFRDQVHLFTNTLYSNYVSCYIKKEKPLIEFSQQYRTHMFNIHKLYMNELRENKQSVTNTFVQKYVNELHPSLLMYCLNFQMRKRNVDTIVADNLMSNTPTEKKNETN
jgi:hypothetical protein